jgi:c-di-GMP-binding flagellar brake protein YcgR
MSAKPVAERRRSARFPLSASITVHHLPSQRDFPARSVDASQGGMLLYLPAAAPMAPGQQVQLYIPAHDRQELADLSERTLLGRVVRVDRQRLPALGYLPVGIKFEE